MANSTLKRVKSGESGKVKKPFALLEGFGFHIEVLPIEKLKPYENNPRKHPEKSIQAIATSMDTFGVKNVVLVDKNMQIIYGHGRVEAAKRLGIKRLPVLVDSEMSKEEAAGLRIADNQITLLSEWEPTLLKSEVLKLKEVGLNLEVLGFSLKEINQIVASEPKGEDPGPGPLPSEPVTRKGDLWRMGSHFLLCGDSTNAEDVDRLLGGASVDLCLTDPPYCVNYENLERRKDSPTRKEMGDSYKDPEDPVKLLKFIELIPCDILVLTFPVNKHFHFLSDATRGWDLLYDCVWVKNHFAFIMSRRYQSKHEPILIFRRKRHKSAGTWNVPSNQSTVFEYDKPAANPDHPTIKPLDLWSQLVQFHSNEGQTIYEPFSGSGTTIIAAEQLRRRVLAMEIDPRYCDVVLRRWEIMSGNKGILEK